MKKWLGRIGFALLVVVLAVFVALASWEPFWASRDGVRISHEAYEAEIVRDEFGVPHIYGARDRDVAYGVALAHSEDDFSTLQDVIAMSRGRYGAIAGPDGAAVDYVYHLLDARGTAERPVTLRAADLDRGFDGVLVLGTAGPSKLEHTTFEGATGIARGPWQVSGGVTFRASPVELFDCSVLDARGEDALNLVHLRFRMERCSFTAGPHDLFDGDFVDGAVVDCRFAEAGEDAVDVSGSVVEVRSCRFDAIGDKALSIGEGSRVVASDCRIERASIAIASKDRSHVDAQRIQVQSVENFVVAAYVKKPEFGPASCTLKELTYGQPGPAPHLAQTGCEVVVDSVTVEPRAVDVDALYEAGVLGK